MATLDIKDVEGKTVGKAEVADAVFGIEPNQHVVHQVVRSQMAARRAGTHDTKTRAEVSGGGRKPWRQKGTGRARAGTTRAGQWKGGGAIFGPHPRSYAFKVPNKMVKLAMRSVLSAKAADGDLVILDDLGMTEPSTKRAAAMLAKLELTGRTTVVVANGDVAAVKSLRNIPTVRVITASEANTYDLVDNANLVMTRPALEWLEGVLA